MSTNNHCMSCNTDFPAAATFCPYCGTAVAEPAPFNKTLVGGLLRVPRPDDTMEMGSVEEFRPGRGHGIKLLVGVAATAAVGAGIWVGGWLSHTVINAPVEAPIAQVVPATPAVATPAVPEVVVSANPDGGFDLTQGAEVIHTVATAQGSRYGTLDERMRSVAVRFKHIKEKGAGRFAARLAGDHYELVWSDSSGDFRLLDVTEKDVEGRDSSADFVANYLADRLNADLPQQNNA